MAYSDMKSALVWDASQSLRLLYNISKLARSEKDSNFALVNLRSLAERFHNRAIDPNYQTSLTVEQKSILEKEFAILADWVQCVKLKKDLNQQHLQNTIELQISILQIVRYVLIKTIVCQSRDYYWSRNAVKLALETAIFCFDAKRLSEMEWCLNEAAFYQLHCSRQTYEFPVQLLAPYLFDSYLLRLLWMMWMYSTKTSYEVFSRYISTLDSIELTVQQSAIITRMCYNIALEHFKLNDYKVAFFWFKYSYRCAKLLTTGQNVHKSSGKALFLMAVSLFKANVLENRDQILNILSCSGTGENVMIDELRFRTLLPGKTNLTDVVQSALKLFGIYVNRERSALRTNVLRVFNALEKHEHFQAVVDLLNHIPWQDPTRANIPSSELVREKELVPHFQWICAEVAVRTCIKQDFQSGCYLWLQEIANWPQSNYVNLESLANILAMGETKAFHLKSHHLALKWFRVLVKITRRHGGRPSIYANALRYALALNTTEGFLAAKQLFYEEISQTELDIQLHRFKLLIAVLDGNQTEAVATWIQLEAQYKKENCLEYEYWEESLQILEVCTMASLQNQNMIEVAVHCLSAMMLEINKPSLQTSMLVRVIRFHMKVLFKLAVNEVSVETKCVENLISTLISALLMLKESFTSPEGPQDSGGLELWFGDLAWSLGCKLSRVVPFYRFQLFKISYKLLSLTPEKDEQVKEKISMSIILSVAAGINSKSHSKIPYSKILGHSFDLIKARLESCTEKDPHKIVQLYFYEFYILCELRDEKGLWKLIQRHQSDVRVKGDHHFFEGLAALASSGSQAFLHQILPPFECQQLEEKHKREPKLQAKLTGLAIVCLKESNSILANVVQPSSVKQIVSNWIRIITFSSENIFMQEIASTQHRLHCEDYRLFIANNREHFSPSELLMFFNYIWNATIETRVFKEPKEAQSWLELLKNVACFSSDLQKLYRSLFKDMQIKF